MALQENPNLAVAIFAFLSLLLSMPCCSDVVLKHNTPIVSIQYHRDLGQIHLDYTRWPQIKGIWFWLRHFWHILSNCCYDICDTMFKLHYIISPLHYLIWILHDEETICTQLCFSFVLWEIRIILISSVATVVFSNYEEENISSYTAITIK